MVENTQGRQMESGERPGRTVVGYTYRDINNKQRIRRTRGQFAGWTEPTGLLNVRYAIFRNRCGDVLVPRYLLTEETKRAIEQVQS